MKFVFVKHLSSRPMLVAIVFLLLLPFEKNLFQGHFKVFDSIFVMIKFTSVLMNFEFSGGKELFFIWNANLWLLLNGH